MLYVVRQPFSLISLASTVNKPPAFNGLHRGNGDNVSSWQIENGISASCLVSYGPLLLHDLIYVPIAFIHM